MFSYRRFASRYWRQHAANAPIRFSWALRDAFGHLVATIRAVGTEIVRISHYFAEFDDVVRQSDPHEDHGAYITGPLSNAATQHWTIGMRFEPCTLSTWSLLPHAWSARLRLGSSLPSSVIFSRFTARRSLIVMMGFLSSRVDVLFAIFLPFIRTNLELDHT